jgi:hypothetical protein
MDNSKSETSVSTIGAPVSFHQPAGMVLSTANLYFTSNDAQGAHVFRTAQTGHPGQEAELYHEPPGNRFGDIVFANVGGQFYGYFWAADSSGHSFIKRVPLSGSPVATVLTPPINDIDIINSHHNLATDGVQLYWQQASSVRAMPIGGGAVITLDPTRPNTPTAGVHLRNGTVVYASVADVRYVPTTGAITIPQLRTIATARTTVTTILPVDNGTYWGDRNGAIQVVRGQTVFTVQEDTGLVPTSMSTNGRNVGGGLAWTQCSSSACQLRLSLPVDDLTSAVAGDALGASLTSSGQVFWVTPPACTGWTSDAQPVLGVLEIGTEINAKDDLV